MLLTTGSNVRHGIAGSWRAPAFLVLASELAWFPILAHGHDALVDAEPEPISYAEAAGILGCGLSNIPKLIAKGQLEVHRQSGRVRGRLYRAEVEALAERRATEKAALVTREPRRYERVDHRPDTEHLWLTPAQAAEQIGVTAQAIRARVKRGRLPAVENGGRVWIRADHFHQAEAARSAMRTREP